MSEFLDGMIPFIVEKGTTEILGDTYEWRIVRQEFEPRLPGFVGLLDGVLFITDTSPPEYREYIFWHEVMCVAKRGRKGCAGTIREELVRVPKHMLRSYTEYRLTCFKSLLEFYRKNPPPFYGEITKSYDYLGLQLHD